METCRLLQSLKTATGTELFECDLARVLMLAISASDNAFEITDSLNH